MSRDNARVWLWGAVLGSLCVRTSVCAKDHFLTVGGGDAPTTNQLSLERNVVFQRAVLQEMRPDGPAHDVYFADGDDEHPDLQCRDAEFLERCPTARRMMAEVLGDADAMDLTYRNHQAPDVRGPAKRALLEGRMRQLARELQPGDRLIIYVTGHGNAEKQDDDSYDYEFDDESQSWKATWNEEQRGGAEPTIYDAKYSFALWNSETVQASAFARWLDRLDPEVQVVLVMVQCYAGGFAHAIFRQVDAHLGLSDHARCGFFAQVHDRGAAGCTPEANEADYEEYSSYFWGALAGKKRSGEPITTADYDENGVVSFAEAHAYAVLESQTIDIPVRTSSALLYHFSHLGKEVAEEEESGDEQRQPLGNLWRLLKKEPAADGKMQLTTLQGPIAALAAIARPEQRAILNGLPSKLGLAEDATVEKAQRELKRAQAELGAATAQASVAHGAASRALAAVQQDVRELWPELNATYSPLAMELTSERASEFAERVGNLAAYKTLCNARSRTKELQAELLEAAHREARLQRLVKTCEDVVRAANLPLVASADVVARYEKLVAMEEGSLAPSP